MGGLSGSNGGPLSVIVIHGMTNIEYFNAMGIKGSGLGNIFVVEDFCSRWHKWSSVKIKISKETCVG